MIKNAMELFLTLLPLVKPLIEEAESVYTEAGQGNLKEDYVIDALMVILKGLSWFKKGTEPYHAMVINVARMAIRSVVGVLNVTGSWGQDIDLSNIPPEGIVIR